MKFVTLESLCLSGVENKVSTSKQNETYYSLEIEMLYPTQSVNNLRLYNMKLTIWINGTLLLKGGFILTKTKSLLNWFLFIESTSNQTSNQPVKKSTRINI